MLLYKVRSFINRPQCSIALNGDDCIDDALKLYNDYRVSIRNCVDLSLLARTVDNARWQGKYTHPLGLARLIESYEYRILVKGKITRSNWEAVLNKMQQECQQHQLFFNGESA